jgi:PhnB protein
MKNSKFIPKGFSALTPMLAVRDAARAIDWYKKIFDATENTRLTDPNGTIAHAELRVGDSIFMLAEEHPDYNRSPETLGGTSVILNLYVEDVDTLERVAIEAGARSIFPVADQFYGDRAGRIQDPFGHMWIISKHIKDVTPEEMQRQMMETPS